MSRSAAAVKETPSIAVVRALGILDLVAARANGLSNSEIATRIKIPKSSASYILRALEGAGYVRRDRENGKYHLGLAVVGLGHRALAGLDIREIAQPVLRQLVEKSGFSAHLAILDRGRAMYIEKTDSTGFVKMNTWIGRRMDLHSTAVGKALSAYLPPETVENIFKGKELTRCTPQTITTLARLTRELEKIREQGYAIDDEENSHGVRCIAAPIFNNDGAIEASIGVTSVVTELEKASVPRVAEQVKGAARKISQQLGFHGVTHKI
jgi:IclR family transcriptional regulator, KDG regulon repressor